jgi:hypothetical protein
LRHTDDHDPVAEWSRCSTCSQALSAAFAKLADMDLSPFGSGRLVEVLKQEALRSVAEVAAS